MATTVAGRPSPALRFVAVSLVLQTTPCGRGSVTGSGMEKAFTGRRLAPGCENEACRRRYPRYPFLTQRTQAFPVLTSAQIDRIRPLGRVRQVQQGEILFEPNDTAIRFFVVLSGSMEIVQPSLDGERALVSHGPGAVHRRDDHDFRAALSGARARD